MTENIIKNAQHLASQHYENFPVAPFFLPKKWRAPIALIYAFARAADDIADEGTWTSKERLSKLHEMHCQLLDRRPRCPSPFFKTLNKMIKEHHLPCQLFHDLLDAFTQDVKKHSYRNFHEVLFYCQRSANPIGRLLLHLTKQDTEQNLKDSDAICTALQLINFLQDIQEDLTKRRRLYIPLEDLREFHVTRDALEHQAQSKDIDGCILKQWQRAHDLLIQGAPLGKRLKGLFGFEIRLTIQGGQTMLQKLRKRKSPYIRPKLRFYDWPLIFIKSL